MRDRASAPGRALELKMTDVLKRASAFDDVLWRVQMYGAADRVRESWRLLVDAIHEAAALSSPSAQEPVNNGNTFVFCDFVHGSMGCVRGAGHTGSHAITLPPYPQQPVVLLSSPSVAESPTWKEKYERAVGVVVPFGCERQPHKSRVCERGTHCCGIRHGKTSAPSAAAPSADMKEPSNVLAAREPAALPETPSDVLAGKRILDLPDLSSDLRAVLCNVSQIFNGWRGCEEWSTNDEDIAQAVVAWQRRLDIPPPSPSAAAQKEIER